MTYREMCGDKVSLLGYGCMRFPVTPDGKIDEEKAERLLDTAWEAGVNYFDAAYPYHGKQCEPFVGRVLAKYPRKELYIATKLPLWSLKSAEEALEIFEEQLCKLRTDYVDFYLFHCLDKEKWERVLALGLIPVFEELQKKGKIRHLGFSFHDDYAVFEEILGYRRWDFCQIQYSYLDREEQAGDRGYALAKERGVSVVVMEPVRGGTLAALPQVMEDVFAHVDENATVASFALRYSADHDNVSVVLSGMTTMEQLTDNLRTFDDFRPLSPAERAAVDEVTEMIFARRKSSCSDCGYCQPCPMGVRIPQLFRAWNTLSMYERTEEARRRYFGKDGTGVASACVECGACEEKCPQHIEIRRNLELVRATFEQ